jgi:hypothetical protein
MTWWILEGAAVAALLVIAVVNTLRSPEPDADEASEDALDSTTPTQHGSGGIFY